jgi:hypothetical protein
MTTGDLFENAKVTKTERDPRGDRISLASHRLAVEFTEDELLPTRYRNSADAAQKKRKAKQDSEVEKRFKTNVQSWRALIETMLDKLEPEQAWRFINLVPKVDGALAKVTDNVDFCDFIDYLSLRRDKENCDADELGGLAQLSFAFQRQVEKHITE